MSAKPIARNIDRNDIVYLISKRIEESANKEAEVSATDLAKGFGVQAPTMNYHLKVLLDEGVFVKKDKKGKFGRQIFTLPKYADYKPKPIINDMASFANLIKQNLDLDKLKKDAETSKNSSDVEQKEPAPEVVEREEQKAEIPADIPIVLPEDPPVEEAIVVSDFSLNSRIEQFLKDSNNIPDASQLISRTDKEILSVMTESIQQQQVYLKDLSNQLELMENLTLLHNLIDERNKMVEEMDQIRKEHNALLSTMSNSNNQVEVDPQRVRLMHQIIINTLDTYLDQPNHSLALQRKEFRSNISKEISDLANYIIGIEG